MSNFYFWLKISKHCYVYYHDYVDDFKDNFEFVSDEDNDDDDDDDDDMVDRRNPDTGSSSSSFSTASSTSTTSADNSQEKLGDLLPGRNR